MQEKAAYVGFDWERIEPVWEKVHEELRELSQAQREADSDAIEQELGDVLFSLVNLGRFLGVWLLGGWVPGPGWPWPPPSIPGAGCASLKGVDERACLSRP